MGVAFNGGLNEILQKPLSGVLAGTCGGLHDDRTIGFMRGLHNGLDLLKVVNVERGDAITVFGSMIEQLTHGNEGHEKTPEIKLI
jgi:hypothetical protein